MVATRLDGVACTVCAMAEGAGSVTRIAGTVTGIVGTMIEITAT
jgi:hypothetical protein